ncbi:exosome complex component RRP46 [Lingula anatina]|uniref:Exosome complex component RRP46 n=1 Tax=Lingula anatina TaxID=7574 RepID=A0A1S3H3Z7_LINAN|nr:exosome complex component RRP46 [Lingula anatina]|eukprot:XP_013380191.1 exosome complex component RRP46 [Lingula anatina]
MPAHRSTMGSKFRTRSSSPMELRPMLSEVSVLSRSDGSASFSQGDCCALAAVYGPGEVKVAKELSDKASVEVVFKMKVGLPGCKEKIQERILRNTCETAIAATLYPRTAIDIVIQEMHNSGSFLATCINCVCMAMLDACVDMKYLVAAVTCGLNSEGELILDPTLEQESDLTALMIFAYESSNFEVIATYTTGSFTSDQFQICLIHCREASKHIFQFFRDTMARKLSK